MSNGTTKPLKTLNNNSDNKIASLPKAELHVHFEGTVDPSTLRILAKKNNISLTEPVALPSGESFAVPAITERGGFRFDNFIQFIGLYLKISQSIKSAEDVVTVVRQYLTQAKTQGIVSSEIYFTPSTFQMLGTPLPELFDGLLIGQRLARTEFDSKLGWIFDIVRNGAGEGFETVELAEQARALGLDVIAIGLAGYEPAAPAAKFKKAFGRAKAAGFNLLAHAGETAGAESLLETVRELSPARIGHGVRVVEDREVLLELRDRGVVFEVCPWSNVLLSVYPEDQHPILQMIDKGLDVVIGADDPGIFGKNLIDNYTFLNADQPLLERLTNNSLHKSLVL